MISHMIGGRGGGKSRLREPWDHGTSYPFMRLARIYDAAYGDVLTYADAYSKLTWPSSEELSAHEERVMRVADPATGWAVLSPELRSAIAQVVIKENFRRAIVSGDNPAYAAAKMQMEGRDG